MRGDRSSDRGHVDRSLERGELLREPLRPAHVDTAHRERAAEERPVGVDEAERAVHGDRSDDVLDERHLAEHAVHELRTVPTDDELLGAGPEQPSLDLQPGRLPRYRFASMTQTPARVITMWSMFARVLGMRRSCSTTMSSEAIASSARPTSASPAAPDFHAAVLWRSPESATAIEPIRPSPHVSRIFSSSRARRRSYSRFADAPAPVMSFVPMVSIQSGEQPAPRAPVRGAPAGVRRVGRTASGAG